MYYGATVIALCAELRCVATITFVSVWGSQLALRGQDGSMQTAVEGMQDERTEIFVCFGVGLIFLLISVRNNKNSTPHTLCLTPPLRSA